MQNLKRGVDEALAASDSGAALARLLGLSRQAIYQWDRVPSDHVLQVEKITGVSRQRLRPDLYPTEKVTA